jgi:genome maintenance exonuclease 1
MMQKNFNHVEHGINLEALGCDTTPAGRFYYPPSGEKFPSVTTVLGVQDKSGLEAWRKRVGEEEAKRISIQAANRGSDVHLIAENYLNNLKDYGKGRMPVNVMTFNTLKPILDSRVDNIYFQEAPLYSRKIKTAGRVDLIAEFDGKLSIIDFKTSKKLKEAKWIEGYFMQESFYAAAFYELTQIPIKQIVTLIMVDDEKPQVFIEQPLKWLPQFIQLRNKYQRLHGI